MGVGVAVEDELEAAMQLTYLLWTKKRGAIYLSSIYCSFWGLHFLCVKGKRE